MRRVKLNKGEMRWAAQIGVERNVEAMFDGRRHRAGMDDGEGWKNHCDGAAGELAFCKAFGLAWDGTVNTFKLCGDVGQVEIRTARIKTQDRFLPRLIIRPEDKDDSPYVLVWMRHPNVFDVVGWAYGRECKRQEFARDFNERGYPAYFVSRGSLRDIETCPRPDPIPWLEQADPCSLAS